jgi:DNA ligase-associated metallophosphoesterase
MTEVEIELKDERIVLLVERAIYWPRMQTLLLADTHWGKDAAFRASAVAVPGGSLNDDLARLSLVLQRTCAQKLIILGDLFHARKGRVPSVHEAVSQWRAQFPDLEITLVRGNHDLKAGDPDPEWRMACVDAPFVVPPFAFVHDPTVSGKGYVLAGHLHPGVRMTGLGRQELTLPCFWFGARTGILPAFGSFTGLAVVAPKIGDSVFVIVENQIIDVI